jgi:CDP-4-dehydro-6-deoxyglucose reductase
MSHKITLKKSQRSFIAEEGEKLLDAALREGVTVPYGCRNGACGACKARLVEGEVDHGQHEPFALTDDDKSDGKLLLCTARAKTDLVIDAREMLTASDIPVRTMPCRVQRIEKPAADVAVLYLKPPSNERLQFLAGQYIDILMKDGKRRAFSLANAPHDDSLLQLHVRYVAGGAFTEYVFKEMKEKDILRFEGPLGTFCLDEASDKPIVFLASGTGFAPVKAILEHAFSEGCQRDMVLYWGGWSLANLYMRGLPEQWAREHPNFRFVPVLSDPKPEDDWSGRTGYVHQAVLEDFAGLSDHQVYACGAPVMVESAFKAFTAERGLPEDQFFSDAFTYAKDGKPAGK